MTVEGDESTRANSTYHPTVMDQKNVTQWRRHLHIPESVVEHKQMNWLVKTLKQEEMKLHHTSLKTKKKIRRKNAKSNKKGSLQNPYNNRHEHI